MADPTSAPDPASIAAGIAAAGSLLHRLLDVGSVRKRLKAVEGMVTTALNEASDLRTKYDALAARVSKIGRHTTGSFPAPTQPQPQPSDPALLERTSAMSGRMGELERRLTGLEEQAAERARWEREIAGDVARLEGHLSARVRRARERESDAG